MRDTCGCTGRRPTVKGCSFCRCSRAEGRGRSARSRAARRGRRQPSCLSYHSGGGAWKGDKTHSHVIEHMNIVKHTKFDSISHLLGDALCDGHGSDAAGLRAPDLAPAGVPALRQVLRHLRRLAAARLPNHHQYLHDTRRVPRICASLTPGLVNVDFGALHVAKSCAMHQEL